VIYTLSHLFPVRECCHLVAQLISCPTGDEISQRAMQLLKVAVKNTGEHKQRIILRINMTGIIILDGVSQVS